MNVLFAINGRIGRRQYLCALLLAFVAWMILFTSYYFYFDIVLKLKLSADAITEIAQPSIFLLMIVPIIKRLHDMNASGWWLCCMIIIEIIGNVLSISNEDGITAIFKGMQLIFGLILIFAPGTKGNNNYGERKSFFKKKHIAAEPDSDTASTLDDIKHLELKSNECGEMVFTAEPEEQLKQSETPETPKHHFIMPTLSNLQKLTFCFSLVSAIMLIMACNDRYDFGFYVFLRIVTCIALIGLCFDRFSVWIKFVLLLAFILYSAIWLGDRDDWKVFNVLTIGLLIVLQTVIIIKAKRNGTSATGEE